MNNYQKLFDGLMAILKKNEATNTLAQKCMKDCAGELAFTPPQNQKATTSKQMLLEVLKRTDEESYALLLPQFKSNTINTVLVWYFDTDRGSYSIYTDADIKQLVGIKYSNRTLKDIRQSYFIQKEALQKVGDNPAYSYDEKEITFINKKLLA